MTTHCFFCLNTSTHQGNNQPLFLFARAVFLLTLVSLVGFSSCQRAPYARFTSTPPLAHQRLALSTSIATPTPDLLATASDKPSFATEPTGETNASAAQIGVAQGALTLLVRRSSQWHSAKRPIGHQPVAPQCDQIVLRSGDVVEAKVKEVGVNEIRYKKCDRPDGPDYTISKRDVLSIKYANGEIERFNTAGTPPSNTTSHSAGGRPSYNSPTNSSSEGLHTDPFAIVAIATGGLAILTGYGAFLLGAAAIVFGALSLSRIRKEPGRFKGRGLAIGGMIAGIVAAGAILLYTLL